DFKAQPIPEFAKRLEGEDLVDYINIVQPFWQANFTDIPEEELKARVMDLKFLDDHTPLEIAKEIPFAGGIPRSYDARRAWPQCRSLRMVRDQAKC
ncbi:hypothetical protein ANCDUO_21834, partial [Ancylostoma duodenale]